jgi:hypothetical protein
MIPGLKIGPLSPWQTVLAKAKPAFVEVWFRLDWAKKYTPVFNYLKKNKISFGLHYWAMISGRYYPNLLTWNQSVAEETFKTIIETLKIGAQWGASYVNFHPEAYHLALLDLNKSTVKIVDQNKPLDRDKSFQQLINYLEKIKQYGQTKGVIPFIETVPKYGLTNFNDMQTNRTDIQKIEGLETERFFTLAEMGYPICFDIGHVISQIISNNRQKVFNYLFHAAKKLKSAVGLMHITTNLPPFNGVDSHSGILDADFKQDVLPNKEQLIKLLSLFKDKDVWLIPEPQKGKMLANYFRLQELVADLQ